VVDRLEFIKRQNRGGRDSVSITLQISYKTSNIQRKFSQLLKTAVTRVSAATFDSSLYPSTNGTLDLGGAGYVWKSINGVLNFSGSNVGIGTIMPASTLDVAGKISAQSLEVNGNIRLLQGVQGLCNLSSRGAISFIEAVDINEADRFQVCIQQIGGGYSWVDL
jgi:hypothetical protein